MTESEQTKYSKKMIDKNRIKIRINDLVLASNSPDFRWGTTIAEIEEFVEYVKKTYPDRYKDIIYEHEPNECVRVLVSRDETDEEVVKRLEKEVQLKEMQKERELKTLNFLKKKYEK